MFYFTGSTYNIPMAIWLRKDHPHQSPIVFVTPTATMGIQPSRFMDRNGMVYLPYLSEWKAVSVPSVRLGGFGVMVVTPYVETREVKLERTGKTSAVDSSDPVCSFIHS